MEWSESQVDCDERSEILGWSDQGGDDYTPTCMTSLRCAWMLVLVTGLVVGQGEGDHFERHIRPLLIDQCLNCHGGEGKKIKGGLDLSSKAGWMKGGDSGPAIVPHRPDQSLLLQAVRHSHPELKMPPKGKLDSAEIQAIEDWIRQGAFDPRVGEAIGEKEPKPAAGADHWAFQPMAHPAPPSVGRRDWCRSELDQFILAELEARNLGPAGEADRRTWLRRVTFDLIGLPPSEAECAQFLADESTGAKERVVDRLLSSAHYGERWGRHWLDLARYADSNGLDENHAMGEAWRYRDWVVAAFNADLPYDAFLRVQIAGDLLPPEQEPRSAIDRLTATGFHVLGPKMLAEQDKPKLQIDTVDEQIDVLSRTFLGLTISCARCHDHKFDPISQADYTRMAGILRSTASFDELGFVSKWKERELATPEEIARRTAYAAELSTAEEKLAAARKDSVSRLVPELTARAPALPLAPTAAGRDAFILEAEDWSRGTLIRDSTHYGSTQATLARTGNPGEQSMEFDITTATSGAYELWIRYAAQESRPVRISVNGKKVTENALTATTGGWKVDDLQWDFATEFALNPGRNVLRIDGPPHFPHLDQLIVARAGAFLGASALADLRTTRGALDEIVARKPPELPRALGVSEGEIQDLKLHVRGSHLNLAGDPIPRGAPEVLAKHVPIPPISEGKSGRLELAEWLTNPEHPLTARVMVNRIWQGHFGRGLVASSSNFGLRGDLPTHPALLDWLARRFIEGGYSIKSLHREIVLSATYGQSSIAGAEMESRDPTNRYYSRMPRRRLEAEAIRDAILAVSGLLERNTGGSLLTTKNRDYVTNDQSGNQGRYESHRRAIYLPIIRNAMYDFFAAFDFADPSTHLESRPSTTVAHQALFFMNSALVRQAAQAVATKLGAGPKTERIERAYALILGRSPSERERMQVMQFLEPEVPTANAAPIAESAWVDLCHTLLATNEFIYVD